MRDDTPTTEILPASGPCPHLTDEERAQIAAHAERLWAELEAREREAHQARGYLLPVTPDGGGSRRPG